MMRCPDGVINISGHGTNGGDILSTTCDQHGNGPTAGIANEMDAHGLMVFFDLRHGTIHGGNDIFAKPVGRPCGHITIFGLHPTGVLARPCDIGNSGGWVQKRKAQPHRVPRTGITGRCVSIFPGQAVTFEIDDEIIVFRPFANEGHKIVLPCPAQLQDKPLLACQLSSVLHGNGQSRTCRKQKKCTYNKCPKSGQFIFHDGTLVYPLLKAGEKERNQGHYLQTTEQPPYYIVSKGADPRVCRNVGATPFKTTKPHFVPQANQLASIPCFDQLNDLFG